VYSYLLRDRFRHGHLEEPVARRTILGWVLIRTAKSATHTSGHIKNFHIKVKPNLSKEL